MASRFPLTRSYLSADLRLVLVGQERVGKSSAGNTILGKKQFDCKFSSRPLTLSSEKREDIILGRRVSVVDTPGLFSTQLSEEEVKRQLEEAIKLSSPGPHIFLLTIQLGRFTEQEQKGLETLEKMLSADVSKYTMVLFTYGDRVEDTDMEQFITEDENLQELLNKCSGQYHVFNDKEIENRDQVKELFDKIDSISKGGHLFYKRGYSVLTQSFWSSMPETVKQFFSSSSQNIPANVLSEGGGGKESERTPEEEGEERSKKKQHKEKARGVRERKGKEVKETKGIREETIL